MTDLSTIPLNRLTAWEGNVRKTQNKGFIDELAASIKAHGLQQNLVVRKQGRSFAVVSGGQRLKALQRLAEEGSIEWCHPIACRLIDGDTDATELSLAENVVRDAMHPADQFEAFRSVIDKGAAVADVAARFGVTPTVVMQRLKLARVSPRVLKAYRKGVLNLEDVMAFAVSDDHAAQDRVLADLAPWQGAREIRAALTEHEVAATDKRVRYVTLKAYEKAGGAVRRDLFGDKDDSLFIADVALLDKLAMEKLERAAKPVRAEGWKWVEVRFDFDYQERSRFHRQFPTESELSPEAAAKLAALEEECGALISAWEEADDDAPRPSRLDELEAEIEQLDDRQEVWTPETLAISGAVVKLGHDGRVDVERGLARDEDVPKRVKPKRPVTSASGDPATGEDESLSLSASLTESLTAQKSAAISAELLERPDVALAAVVHAFAVEVLLEDDAANTSLRFAATPQPLHRVEGAKAFDAMVSAREFWGHQIPGTPDALWSWCILQDQNVLLDLLAFCAATTVSAVQLKADHPDCHRLRHAAMLAATLNLDMKSWFTPTAENYFSRVSKPHILAAIREARGTAPAPTWEKLKKADLATVAERETAGTGWLPPPLR